MWQSQSLNWYWHGRRSLPSIFIFSVFLFSFFSFYLFSSAQILAEKFIMNLRLNFENGRCRLDLQTIDINSDYWMDQYLKQVQSFPTNSHWWNHSSQHTGTPIYFLCGVVYCYFPTKRTKLFYFTIEEIKYSHP